MVRHMKDMLKYNAAIKILGRSRKSRQIQGTTLAEALVTIVVVGVLSAIAAPNILATGSKPLPDTTDKIAGQFRAARAKAVAQTTLFRIRPTNAAGTATITNCASASGGCINTQLTVERVTTATNANAVNTAVCSTDDSTVWVKDGGFNTEDLTFGQGISISNVVIDSAATSPAVTDWQLCFNTRGVANKDLILTLQQAGTNKTQRIEIFPGGMVQVYAN